MGCHAAHRALPADQRADVIQPHGESPGMRRLRAVAGPIEHQAAAESLRRDGRLEKRGIERKVRDRGLDLAPIALFAQDIDHAVAAQEIVAVGELGIGDLDFIALAA